MASSNDLNALFAAQKAAFLKDQRPSLEVRKERLNKVIGMMMSNRQAIRDALASDFGNHPNGAGDLIECLGPVGRAAVSLLSSKLL